MIYAYILCNFQCTTCVSGSSMNSFSPRLLSNSGNKITKDNLLTLSLHYAVNDRYTT